MNPAEKVLAGIIPNRRDRLITALGRLEIDHFRSEQHKNMFGMLERYYDVSAEVLPLEVMTNMLQRAKVEASKTILYEELYTELAGTEVPDDVFNYSLEALRDLRAEQLTGEALTTAFEILERGVEIKGQEFRGHKDSRDYLYSELGHVDKLGGMEAAPEGDIRVEGNDIREEYVQRKEKGSEAGIFTGIDYIDRTTVGFQNGELVLVAAFTGEGKSMLSTQTAWHASVMQGKNVFFVTTETSRATTRRRILARHSRLPQFDIPGGLDSHAIKNAALTPDEEAAFLAVVEDLQTNPAYGKLYISQVPRGGSLDFVEARLGRQQANWNVDLVVIDYLALLRPERSRQSQREELAEIVMHAKLLATGFDGGRGVPVISPWQMSQESYNKALERGHYTLANLGDTIESERSSDVILSLLRDQTDHAHARLQFLKNRDGDIPQSAMLDIDYRSVYLTDTYSNSQGAESLISALG